MKSLIHWYVNLSTSVRNAFFYVSMLVLIGILVLPIAYVIDAISLQTCKNAILALTIVWFVFAPIWMRGDD